MSKGVAYVKTYDRSKRPPWKDSSPPRYISHSGYRSRQRRTCELGQNILGSQSQAKRLVRQAARQRYKKMRALDVRLLAIALRRVLPAR